MYLEYNQLETIPEDTFLGLGQLNTLAVTWNNLSSLNASLVSRLSHLTVLKLDHKPLVCGCQLIWVRTKATTVTLRAGVCANPPVAKNKSVTSYDVSLCNLVYMAKPGTGVIFSIGLYIRHLRLSIVLVSTLQRII